MKPKVWAGSVHSLVKDVSSKHTIVSCSSAERSALVCINYVTKLSLNEKGTSVCRNRKQFQIRFRESVWSIYELTICSVLHVS